MAHQQIIELDPDETLILTVKRSLWGLVPVIFTGLLVLAGVLLSVYLIARFQDSVAATIPVGVAIAFVLGLAVLIGIMILVHILVYLRNLLLVTSERLVVVIQRSLFSRSISQMSLDQVQEVTVVQKNIFENLFNFGSLNVETAGEKTNFDFKHAASPFNASKQIDEAKEAFVAP